MESFKSELMKKCIEAIHNSDPDLMEDKIVKIQLSETVTLILDVKYVQTNCLKLVAND